MQNWMVFSMLLCAKDICKKIRGKTVLSHVNLELESGTIYGFALFIVFLFAVITGWGRKKEE